MRLRRVGILRLALVSLALAQNDMVKRIQIAVFVPRTYAPLDSFRP